MYVLWRCERIKTETACTGKHFEINSATFAQNFFVTTGVSIHKRYKNVKTNCKQTHRNSSLGRLGVHASSTAIALRFRPVDLGGS